MQVLYAVHVEGICGAIDFTSPLLSRPGVDGCAEPRAPLHPADCTPTSVNLATLNDAGGDSGPTNYVGGFGDALFEIS